MGAEDEIGRAPRQASGAALWCFLLDAKVWLSEILEGRPSTDRGRPFARSGAADA
jgi:hypothetical protein